MSAGQLESLSILEVSVPVRGERVSVRLLLNVALDGSLGGINQPRHQRLRTLRVRTSYYSKAPLTPSEPVPVSICDPGSGLLRMTALRPLPERVPEAHRYFLIRRRSHDMTVIVCPAPDHRVEHPYQVLLLRSAILMNRITYLFQKSMHVLLGGGNQEFAVIFAQVLPQEVEPLVDMRD